MIAKAQPFLEKLKNDTDEALDLGKQIIGRDRDDGEPSHDACILTPPEGVVITEDELRELTTFPYGQIFHLMPDGKIWIGSFGHHRNSNKARMAEIVTDYLRRRGYNVFHYESPDS